MKVYHASYMEVNKPIIIEPNRPLDFGTGFYLTNKLEQAENWCNQMIVKYNR